MLQSLSCFESAVEKVFGSFHQSGTRLVGRLNLSSREREREREGGGGEKEKVLNGDFSNVADFSLVIL